MSTAVKPRHVGPAHAIVEGMKRDVSARIVLNVTEPADLVFAISAAAQYAPTNESFTAAVGGQPVEFHEVPDAHGTRLHRMTAPAGELFVEYSATVDGESTTEPASETDVLTYSRPSRYAESDSLAGMRAFGALALLPSVFAVPERKRAKAARSHAGGAQLRRASSSGSTHDAPQSGAPPASAHTTVRRFGPCG